MTNVELNLNSLNKELGTDYESLLELCQKHTIPESLIDKYWGILDMLVIVKYQKLSDEFLEKHWNELSLSYLTTGPQLSEYIIEKYFNDLYTYYLFDKQKVPERLIDMHWNKLSNHNKIMIFKKQKLSDDFIIKHR